MKTIIKQGAEATVFKSTFFGREVIVKHRFKKHYRHPQLDAKLTRRRTLQEVRSMFKCHKVGIKTPIVFFVDYDTHKIYMEEIKNGCLVKDEINSLLANRTSLEKVLFTLAQDVGTMIAKMHSAEIIHGDLTTSNILMQNDSRELCIIDFGLSSISNLTEDMAVDLYVLERAFLSTHPGSENIFTLILDSYVRAFSDAKKVKEVIKKLNEVRCRGRKRDMTG